MSCKISASSMGIKVTSGLPASHTLFTMMGWFTVRTQTAFGSILAFGTSGAGNNYINMSISNATLATVIFNGGSDGSSGTSLAFNKRFHAAMTSDGTTIRGYINGVQACTQTDNAFSLTATDLFFGTDADSEFLDCDVEDIRIFNACLRSRDIAQEMMSDVPVRHAVCTHASRLLDQTDLRDRSGRGHNAVLVGAPTRGTNLRGARPWSMTPILVPLTSQAVAGGGGGGVVNFRKTLSGIGTRAGSRQAHGW